MPVTMPLLLGAMAKKRYSLFLRQVLEQAKSKLLAVIFDSPVPRIDATGLEQFLRVTPAEFRPRYFAVQDRIPQLFTRAEVRHPDIEPIRRQSVTPSSGSENPESVARFNSAMD